MSQSII